MRRSLRPDPASLTALCPTRRHPVNLLHTFTPLGAEGQSLVDRPGPERSGQFLWATIGGGAFGVGTIFELDTAESFQTLTRRAIFMAGCGRCQGWGLVSR